MLEVKKEYLDSALTPTPPVQAEQALAPANEAAKPFHSAGRRIHNEITYRGIDWLLNSSVGVAFAYWSARKPSGEKYFGNPVSGVFKAILKPFLKTDAATAEGAKWGTKFAGIMAGGFAIIPIMTVMENRNVKKGVIRWLDEKIYGEEKVKNDPQFEAAYRAIDEEPKKGFKTGMISRFIAIAPLITISSIPATNKPLIKYLYDPLGNVSKWAMKKLGIKPNKMLMHETLEHLEGDPNIKKQPQNDWDFLHRTIGFDFGLTIFYSIFHEISYKCMAALEGKRKKQPVVKPAPEIAATMSVLDDADGKGIVQAYAAKALCATGRCAPKKLAGAGFREALTQRSGQPETTLSM